MSGNLRAQLFAAALFLPATLAAVTLVSQPALAQSDDYENGDVSFRMFYDRLAPYGQWFESDRWGYVWQPEDVDQDFRPYYNGHWVYTDRYGWYWVSDEEWGDVVYHYGRWVYDPDDGWLWIPGYVWAPAWVIWREGEGSTGWFPMPPNDDFYAGDESWRDDWADYAADDYGYQDWYGPAFAATFFSLWTFVDDDHFDDHHFHRYVRHHRDYDDRDNRDFFRRTRDKTHYTSVDNYVVNRGINPDFLRRRTGRRIEPVPLRDIARPHAPAPTPIELGRKIRRREIERRPSFTPRWVRERTPQAGPRFPFQTGPRKPRQNTRQNPAFNPPRFPSGPTPGAAPATPQGNGPNEPAWRRRFDRTQGPAGPAGGPNGNNAPSGRGFTPTVPPRTPAVTPPPPPERPAFERRDWRRSAPATNAPTNQPPSPERKRFERFQAPSTPRTPPPSAPTQRFERYQPPSTPKAPPPSAPAQRFERYQPPATRTPPSPPPAASQSTPPPQPADRHEERTPRDHPHRDRPDR